MTTTITERDKKLILVVTIVMGCFLLVYYGIWPLWTGGEKIKDQIAEQQLEKQEKELKIVQYPVIQAQQESAKEQLAEKMSLYYEEMRSVEIDRLMTGMALSHGLVVKKLDITEPDKESYVVLPAYKSILAQEEETGEITEPLTYDGVYAATVSMSLTGDPASLQQLMDEIVALHPKQQLVKFHWQKSGQPGENATGLEMTVALYMCENVDKYMEKQQAAEETAEETTEETTEETGEETGEEAVQE